MLYTLKLFVDMCLLRGKPQDLPHSRSLEIIAIAVYFGLSDLLALLSLKPATAAFAALVDTAMMVGLAHAGLWALNLQNRSVKLITALAGTGAIWQLIALPLLSATSGTMDATGTTTVSTLAYLVFVALIAWAVAIIGHILRHAFDMKFFFALGIAVLYVYTSMRVGTALFIAAQ